MTGPMARSVDDLALLLRVQAGHDPRSPLSLDTDAGMFDGPFDRDWTGARIGWLGDFGGATPCEPGLLDLCRGALSAFETIGCTVEETSIDFPADDAWRAYLTLRAWQTGGGLLPLYRQPARRALLKPEAIFEVEAGMRLSAYDITAASGVHAQWSEAVRRQFARFDFLIAPTAQMFPFPIEQDWPKTINGRSLETYCEWMKVACLVTLSGCPALAAPAGFSPSGLPIGIQIIGPGRSDRACLEIAHAYEQARDWTQRRQPPMLASPSVSRAG